MSYDRCSDSDTQLLNIKDTFSKAHIFSCNTIYHAKCCSINSSFKKVRFILQEHAQHVSSWASGCFKKSLICQSYHESLKAPHRSQADRIAIAICSHNLSVREGWRAAKMKWSKHTLHNAGHRDVSPYCDTAASVWWFWSWGDSSWWKWPFEKQADKVSKET